MRILLVEDEPTLNAQLTQALQTAGYVVDACNNGRTAWALGDVDSFDAVVLDLGLPEMDGLTVLKRWRTAGQRMPVLTCGPIELDTRSSRVTLDGQHIPLTSHEYKVLAYLMHHPQAVVSRSELTEHIYAQDFDRDSNTIEVFVGRLRKKLGLHLIETVRGLGYRLVIPE